MHSLRSLYSIIIFLLMLSQTVFTHLATAQTPYVEKFGPIQEEPPDTLAWRRYKIEGYADKTSVIQGDPINFMVANGDSSLVNQQYNMKIFRVGRGGTDSLVYTVPDPLYLQYQPLNDDSGAIPRHLFTRKPIDYRTGCYWPVAYTVDGSVTSGWKSGFYYVKCSLVDNSSISRRFPFVIRQSVPGSTSKILYLASFSVYYAYASWGGGSLYPWTNPTLTGGDTVSFLRPLGGNYGDEATNDIGSFEYYERNFIQWAEQSGYVIEYGTNIDLHADRSFISSYKFLVIGGHDEYCSYNERAAVEANFIRDNGNNVAFLSANMFYWLVDYPLAENYTRMWCHKDASNTNLWRNQPVSGTDSIGGPEAKFIGAQYEIGYNLKNCIDTVRLASHWLFNGTGLQNESAFGFGAAANNPGILGPEIDHTFSPGSPGNVEVLTSAWVDSTIVVEDSIHREYAPVLHESTFYIDTTSNARVFDGGSNLWSSGLWSFNSQDQSRFRTFATNLMDHFSGKKYIGGVYTIFDKALIWNNDIELDGNVEILDGKYLISQSNTITIDNGVTFFVDGTLEINGNVTIAGSGSLNINPGGTLLLKSNSTLTISPSAYFVLESGGDVVFGSGAKLILNYATIEAGASLSVESGGILQIEPAGHIAFGVGAGLSISGTLSAEGTSGDSIIFTRTGTSDYWSGTLNQLGYGEKIKEKGGEE